MSLVTVIIPSYNHSQYLKTRIDSVLNQTFKDFEIIILDDASTDNSKEIIEFYRSNKKVINIIYNKKNSGSVFKQWVKGIELSQSPYTWIAESDDWADVELLSALVNKIEESEEIGLVFADVKIMNSDGIYTGENFSDFQNKFNPRFKCSYINEGYIELKEGLAYWCTINNVSSVLFRTKFLKSNKFNLSKFHYAGDWATYVSIASQAKIAYIH